LQKRNGGIWKLVFLAPRMMSTIPSIIWKDAIPSTIWNDSVSDPSGNLRATFAAIEEDKRPV
jgi:hypothetical protein